MTASGETGAEEKGHRDIEENPPVRSGADPIPKDPSPTTPKQTRCFVSSSPRAPLVSVSRGLGPDLTRPPWLRYPTPCLRLHEAPGLRRTKHHERKKKGRLGNRNRRSFTPPFAGLGAEPYASEKEPKVVSASRPAPWPACELLGVSESGRGVAESGKFAQRIRAPYSVNNRKGLGWHSCLAPASGMGSSTALGEAEEACNECELHRADSRE